MKKRTGKIFALLLSLTMVTGVIAGCGSEKADSTSGTQTEVTTSADAAGKKTFVFGDTTFNAENEESNIDPHSAYCGWACIRYGVGETLMKINDSMQLEPWIAEGYELVDDLTWKITLKDGVCFSNGKSCDAEAVKKCLEDLVAVHERAAGDLKIDFSRRQVSLAGEEIHFSPVEYRILECLALNSGTVVTYQMLLEKIWGPYASSGSRILRVNMTNIRKKIEKIPMDPTYITTIPRVGYRMLESQTASVV